MRVDEGKLIQMYDDPCPMQQEYITRVQFHLSSVSSVFRQNIANNTGSSIKVVINSSFVNLSSLFLSQHSNIFSAISSGVGSPGDFFSFTSKAIYKNTRRQLKNKQICVH